MQLMCTRRPRCFRQHGTAIFLVMVVLALLTVLATAYLQMARMHAQAAKSRAPLDNSLTVALSGVDVVRDLLKKDIVNSNGEFFANDGTTPATEPYDYPFTNLTDSADSRDQYSVRSVLSPGTTTTAIGGHGDDMWLASSAPDFSGGMPGTPTWPHISNICGMYVVIPESTAPAESKLPVEFVVNPQTAPGSDVFCYQDTNVPINGAGSLASQPSIDLGSLPDSVPDYQAIGVDGDGDGVPDARWTWAPIRQIGGKAYVIAYRVMDLSSMLNVETATAMTTDGGEAFPYVSVDSPRGLFPTDVDLSRLISRAGSSSWASELYDSSVAGDSLFELRGFTAAANSPAITEGLVNGTGLANYSNLTGSAFYTANSTAWSWFARARVYGNPNLRGVRLSDEFEIRYRGGLSNSNNASSLEQAMSRSLPSATSSLRRWTSTENLYTDVDYTATGSSTSDEKMMAYFQGAQFGAANNPAAAVDGRSFPAIRHWITGYSGASVFAPNHNNIHSNGTYPNGARALQYDLASNDFNFSTKRYDPAARIVNISNQLLRVLSIGDASGVVGANAYLGIDATSNMAELQRISLEYALAIHDYSDARDYADATDTFDPPTAYTLSGTTYYGLEVLPFLREVYVQAGFEDVDTLPADTNFDVWKFKLDSQAMAIEIGNPFDRPMDFSTTATDNRVCVRIVVDGSSLILDETTCTFSSSISILPARGRAIIYTNPAQTTPEPARDGVTYVGTKGASLLDLNFTQNYGDGVPDVVASTTVAGALTFPMPLTGASVSVQLQVSVGRGGDGIWGTVDDTWVRYDQMSLSGINFSNADIAHTPWTPQQNAHAQAAVARDGRNLRYLSNDGSGLVATVRMPAEADQAGFKYDDSTTPNTPVAALNRNTKGFISNSIVPDNFQIPHADRKILSVAEIGWILMFGFNDSAAGSFPEVFDALAASRRFLDLGSVAPPSLHVFPVSIPAATGIPHAAMLMDQFTTLSPRYDGIDNDNADNDNDSASDADNSDAEQFVPGTINVNTAPDWLLTLSAPLPESISSNASRNIESLAQAIKLYRENAFATVALWREEKLSASLRSQQGIASIGELLFLNPYATPSPGNMQLHAENGSTDSGTDRDVYPMPEEVGSSPFNASRRDDVDGPEEKMARYYSLRQVFTTRSDLFAVYIVVQGFPAGDFRSGPVESKRIMAILDRSGITSSDSTVRVVGVYQLN